MVTVQIARWYLAVEHPHTPTPTESTIRSWLTRGNIQRAPDGGIDLPSLIHWITDGRDHEQARRRTCAIR